MADCSFCGKGVDAGTGKMFVRKDGRIFNYCCSKCEKNHLKLERRARSVRWTQAARQAKEERMHAAQAEAEEKEAEPKKKAKPKKEAEEKKDESQEPESQESEKPTMNNLKAEIIEYLEANDIDYNKSMTKQELLDSIEEEE